MDLIIIGLIGALGISCAAIPYAYERGKNLASGFRDPASMAIDWLRKDKEALQIRLDQKDATIAAMQAQHDELMRSVNASPRP